MTQCLRRVGQVVLQLAEIVEAPKEGQAGTSAEKEPDRWNVPSGFQRTPGNKT